MALRSGDRLGPYELVAPLGSGAMGEVWRARDPRLGRELAIKLLPEEEQPSARALSRLEAEARAASALNQPNIVTIYELGKDDGRTWIAMELCAGQSLREIAQGGALPVRKALEIGRQIAEGLAAAHARGIVHRDLKPENIVVTDDGVVKILDFGLAKQGPELLAAPDAEGSVTGPPTMTAEGSILGTVGYMSPEQASGRRADFRSDQFALGAILYELVSGRRAFRRATSAETLAAIVREEPEPLRRISGRLPAAAIELIERCLEKDPADRYASTRDLAFDLKRLATELASHPAGRRTVGEALARAGDRLRREARLLLVASGVAVALAALAWLALGRASVRPVSATAPVQLTVDPAFDGHPALAPDGRSVVFVSERRGLPELWVHALAEGVERPLLAARVAAVDPTFSPDGAWIAFAAPGGGIWRVPAAGGEPREITEFGSRPAFSPDGREIVFQSEEPLGFRTTGWEASRASTIWLVEIASGRLSQLTYRGSTPGGHGAPAWSPDGRTIVFVASEYFGTALWRIAARGGQIEPVVSTAGILRDPIFDVDGEHLFAVRTSGGGGWAIVRVALAGPIDQQLETVVPVAPVGTDRISLARDGSFLAYGSQRGSDAIEHLAPTGSGGFSLPARTLVEPQELPLHDPSFLDSECGRLAYVRNRPGVHGDLLIRDLARGSTRELREIVSSFYFQLGNGRLALHRKDLATDVELDPATGRTRLLFEGKTIPPPPTGSAIVNARPSRDLSQVLFTLRSGTRYQIYLKSPTAPWPPPLVEGEDDDWGALSPDGRLVAFERAANHGYDLWLVGANAKGLRRLAAGGQNWTGAFSPDSSRVAFLRLQDGAWNVWTVGFDGAPPHQLTDNQALSTTYAHVQWSTCGLTWVRNSQRGEVWTLRLER